jgi:integrase
VGQQPESAATVGYLLDQYMAVADLDVSTREGYEGYIHRTVKPALGGMELRNCAAPCWTRSTPGSDGAAI